MSCAGGVRAATRRASAAISRMTRRRCASGKPSAAASSSSSSSLSLGFVPSARDPCACASACLRRAVRVHPLATPGPAVELEMGARAAEYDGGNAELGMRGSTVGLVDATLDQSER